MRKLFGIITALFTLVITVSLFFPKITYAADVRTGNDVIITQNQTNLKDLYLFGRTIDLSAPVTNDVTAAGGNVNISGSTSNNLTVAGGTVILSGNIGNTARVAGGNVTIDGPVANDLVVAGGTVTINKHASVGQDLLVAGGQVTVEGPVKGKILMSGGDITLNSAVGGNVTAGHIGTFTLGPEAKINGSLTYTSSQPLTKQQGSVVKGPITYRHVEKPQPQKQQSAQTWLSFGIYQLLVEVVLSVLIIYIFRNGIFVTLMQIKRSPWKNLGIGFVYILLAPVVSFILLVLWPLGIASFLMYLLILLINIFVRDIFAGWLIVKWWDRRNKKDYVLDWKAGVIGPIAFFIINLLPILGWLISSILYLIGIGALLANLIDFMPRLQTASKKK